MLTINSLSFDGILRKSWKVELLEASGSLLIAKGVFDRDVEHPNLNVIRRGTVSYEYFWLDRWYNVFRLHEPDGSFRNYYCNICMPPRMSGQLLDYVDLDIDIVVDSTGRFAVLDEEEFRDNANSFGYSEELKAKSDDAVAELLDLIKRREFPFDLLQSVQPKPGMFVIESSDLDHQ